MTTRSLSFLPSFAEALSSETSRASESLHFASCVDLLPSFFTHTTLSATVSGLPFARFTTSRSIVTLPPSSRAPFTRSVSSSSYGQWLSSAASCASQVEVVTSPLC